MSVQYPQLALRWSAPEDHLFRVSQAVNGVLNGQTNNVLAVTLRANQMTTELVDDRIHPDTVPLLTPKTANAAAAAVSYAFTTKGKITLTHDSSALTDRSFGVVLCG